MLGSGLGEALSTSLNEVDRVFDLFTGSAAVAWYMAEVHKKQVFASDLQLYSVVLAASVIERTTPVDDREWVDIWMRRASEVVTSRNWWREVERLQVMLGIIEAPEAASIARALTFEEEFSISRAYGGYYFSPWQSAWIDALIATMPRTGSLRNIGLAALIQAASRCAASPGHTAQPFKANATAGRYLLEAWRRDLPAVVRGRIEAIAPRTAGKKGGAYQKDAKELAEDVRPRDLVFLDPPYSGVHYSRFYHVLESIARGKVGSVSGVGRYPERAERPISNFSMLTTSRDAFDEILAILSRKNATVLITFPAGNASNGLSGEDVKVIAANHFYIKEAKVASRFSTMGGDLKHRAARQDADELILTLSKKKYI